MLYILCRHGDPDAIQPKSARRSGSRFKEYAMKRIALALIVSCALVGVVFAQSNGYGPMGGRFAGGPGYGAPLANAQTKTLDGTLTFVNKVPAIKTKDATYIIRMPGFFRTAYLDGIKEGATMKLEGYDLGNVAGQDNPYFLVTKASINGKTYDLGQFGAGRMGGFRGGAGCAGPQGGFGGGPGYGMMGGRGW